MAIPDAEAETLRSSHRLNVWTAPPSERTRYNISAQGGYPGLFLDLKRKANCPSSIDSFTLRKSRLRAGASWTIGRGRDPRGSSCCSLSLGAPTQGG